MLLHRTQESEKTVVELNKKLQKALEQAKTASVENQHSLVAGMNAHVSKLVEMTVLEKTIRSIKSGGGAPNRRALNSDKWKVTRHKRIEKDS